MPPDPPIQAKGLSSGTGHVLLRGRDSQIGDFGLVVLGEDGVEPGADQAAERDLLFVGDRPQLVPNLRIDVDGDHHAGRTVLVPAGFTGGNARSSRSPMLRICSTMDASTIDLCLAAFPGASFRRTKGGIKLHVGMDQAGHLPTFISVTHGKTGGVRRR